MPSTCHDPDGFAEVVPAGFERPLAPGGYQPGGYLQEAPGFPASGPGGWWAVNAADMDALKTKNEELKQRQEVLIENLQKSQLDLVETRDSLLASMEECSIARSELTATREELLQWRKQTEAALRRYHLAEQEHLAELDAMLVLLQDFFEKSARD
ncbi:MAG: hypothetical protein EA424_21550 [Planctomycetaceae bacterium]|nr:MAG: hypothetical protein EA424_21550 [Planctomycetaceae bacterium]